MTADGIRRGCGARLTHLFATFAVLGSCAVPAGAATLNVPAQYPTIQAGINAAAAGDTVLVAPGTYTGVGNVDLDFTGKDITVESSAGAASTIIDSQGSTASPHRAFILHSGETAAAVVQGFTIQNGNATQGLGTGITVYNSGSGIMIYGASPTIRQCVFTNNYAFYGGAILVKRGNSTITQCNFMGNRAFNGGAILLDGTMDTVTTGVITDCAFASNHADDAGGAIEAEAPFVYPLSADVVNCSFYGNNATYAGTLATGIPMNVQNCIFQGDLTEMEFDDENGGSTVSYCDINQARYAGSNHNFNVDPNYINPTRGNLHLQPFSPCIAMGSSAGAPTVDYDGNPWTTNISIGAYNAVATQRATHFSFSVPASATAGTSLSFTVTALAANNSTATHYGGTVHFTSGDPTAKLPADATLTNGVGTFSATLRTGASATITATDTVFPGVTGTSSAIALTPLAATHFSIAAPASATAGAPVTFTVTARDQFGNAATGYNGTAHFTGTDPQAVLPADTTLTSGTKTVTATFKTPGNQTVAATDTVSPSITGVSSQIAVSPAAATHLTIAIPTATSAGNSFSATVTALDAFGNTAAGYTGTLHFASSDPQALMPPDTVLTGGTGSFAVALARAGNQTLTVTDSANAITGATGTVTVNGAAVPFLEFRVRGPFVNGAPFSFNVIAIANRVQDTAYAGTIHFTSSDPHAVLPPDTALTGGQGSFSITLNTLGNQTITVTDVAAPAVTNTQAVDIVNLPAVRFAVLLPSTATTGSATTVAVTALDANGDTAKGYSGTVHFSSTDSTAILPADAMLTNGSGTFPVTFNYRGRYVVTATDTASSGITGFSSAVTVSP